MKIAIIGAGASGMMAAITAAENPKNEILLLERQNRVGRKLLATGNGRCNLSNTNTCVEKYHGTQPAFPAAALAAFDVVQTKHFFHDLGLLLTEEPSGRLYPYSDQANSVVDVLRFALMQPNISTKLSCEVRHVKKQADTFLLQTPTETFTAQKLVVACGGLAGSKLGGSMSGYQILRSLGHSCTKLHPALVQLRTEFPLIHSLKGIRAEAKISIFAGEDLLLTNRGEVQFTDFGISGPAVFEISRHVSAQKNAFTCSLDLLEPYSVSQIISLLQKRQTAHPELLTENLLTGLVHNRLGRTVVQYSGLPLNMPLQHLPLHALELVAHHLKHFQIPITEPMGMDSAQVTAGGIFTAEFNPVTMESLLCPGLYATGEVLDVDGNCGGYNLQWAWSSGHAAGTALCHDTSEVTL